MARLGNHLKSDLLPPRADPHHQESRQEAAVHDGGGDRLLHGSAGPDRLHPEVVSKCGRDRGSRGRMVHHCSSGLEKENMTFLSRSFGTIAPNSGAFSFPAFLLL
jgi:hypothetical protein